MRRVKHQVQLVSVPLWDQSLADKHFVKEQLGLGHHSLVLGQALDALGPGSPVLLCTRRSAKQTGEQHRQHEALRPSSSNVSRPHKRPPGDRRAHHQLPARTCQVLLADHQPPWVLRQLLSANPQALPVPGLGIEQRRVERRTGRRCTKKKCGQRLWEIHDVCDDSETDNIYSVAYHNAHVIYDAE